MTNSNSISEYSKKLSKENIILMDSIKKVNFYLFSSKIRPIVFGDTFGKEKEKIFIELMFKLDNIYDLLIRFRVAIEEYYKEVKHSNIFTLKRHFGLAKRFIYNSITNTQIILRTIKKIKADLSYVKNTIEPRKKQALFRSIRQEFDSILNLFNENNVLLSDIQGRLQIELNLVSGYENLKRYLIDKSSLETGDILISCKPRGYLKEVLISRMISTITNSQVTHVLLVAKLSPSDIEVIDSYEDTGGVHLRNLEVIPGEVFIVFRPKISLDQRAMLLHRITEYIRNKAGFSMAKLIGVLPSTLISKFINIFSLGYKQVPNIITIRRTEFFCSEFINQIFKEAGLLLTPKSRYSSMVSPSDIVASPFINYKGLIFEDSEKSKKIIMYYQGNAKI